MDAKGGQQRKDWGTFIVRTAGNPLAMASILRREVPRAWPEFRVSAVHTQEELVRADTVRERLLALLALFFGAVALLLAGIGLYGVLHHSVVGRRREIGIRLAVGAPAGDIARRVTGSVFSMVLIGGAAGLAIGLVSARYVETLLYEVRATELSIMLVPALTVAAAAMLAAIPAVIHALPIDPVRMRRVE